MVFCRGASDKFTPPAVRGLAATCSADDHAPLSIIRPLATRGMLLPQWPRVLLKTRPYGRTMATRIVQIDLAKPILPVGGLSGYGRVWLLIRHGRRPVGWVKFSRTFVGQ